MPMIRGESICEKCNTKFSWTRSDKVVTPRFCTKKCWNDSNAKDLPSLNDRRFQWKKATEEQKKEKLKESFEAKVVKKEGCWDWKGCFYSNDYALIHIHNGEKWVGALAHRVSYKLHIGPIPDGLYVCHTCDNRKCTNPEHLWLGTCLENSKDMRVKGRECRGESRSLAKLKDDDIREIRKMLMVQIPSAVIARKYKVSNTVISYIKNGKTWKHVK